MNQLIAMFCDIEANGEAVSQTIGHTLCTAVSHPHPQLQSSLVASAAPAANASSLAHITFGWTR